jgi:nicotinamide riboside kinase
MWHLLIPEARKQLVRPITLFGADSCGKTTTAKQVAAWYQGQFIPEYARGYLEVKGTDITPEKMWEIAKGQYAQDVSTLDNPMHRMVIRDTDLLTTYGYLKLFNIELSPQQMGMLRVMINSSYSDLYVIMDTDIPFAVDSQRYGGDKRQSDNQFWVDILEQFKLNYVVVGGEFNGFEHNPRRNNVVAAINKFYRDQNKI